MRSCMTFPSRLLNPCSLIILAMTATLAFAAGGVGSVSGKSSASYEISFPNGGLEMPSMRNDGYDQRAVKTKDGWLVEVSVSAGPLRAREEWFLTKKMEKSLAAMDRKVGRAMAARLAGAVSRDEAVMAVLRFIGDNWSYVQKDDSGMSLEEMLASREASCLGMVRLAGRVLDILGIPSSEITGIRFPACSRESELRGGALHAWLEVEVERGRRVFCDPMSSFGFVPQYFIVLRRGGGLSREELRAVSGGKVILTSNEDRIFYDPMSSVKPDFWVRPPFDSASQGVLLGKALERGDMPARGKARLSCGDRVLECELWDGNFYFKIASPGTYVMDVLPAAPARPSTLRIELSDLSRRMIVVPVEGGEVSH